METIGGRAVHPLADIFPLLEGAEFDAFADDIRQHGLREPITLLDNAVLDGRNRLRGCLAVDVAPRFQNYIGEDPRAYVVSVNMQRRHLTESQRGMVAAKLATMRSGHRTDIQPPANLPEVPEPPRPISQPEAAEMLNVSERLVRDATTVLKKGVPELVENVQRGRAAVSAAAAVAKLPPEVQQEAVQWPKLPTAAEARTMAREKGVSVIARDGKLHDGRTVEEERADGEAAQRSESILHQLEEIIEIIGAGMTPQAYFDAIDLPRFGRVGDRDLGIAWAKVWPWFCAFNTIWERHLAAG